MSSAAAVRISRPCGRARPAGLPADVLTNVLVSLAVGLFFIEHAAASPADVVDGTEERFITLAYSLPSGLSADTVRRIVPEMPTPVPSRGIDTHASFSRQLFGVDAEVRFSFHHGRLVSYGISAEGLDRARVLKIYRRVRNHFSYTLGKPSKSAGPSEDAHGGFYQEAKWVHGNLLVGVYYEVTASSYSVGWGSQVNP